MLGATCAVVTRGCVVEPTLSAIATATAAVAAIANPVPSKDRRGERQRPRCFGGRSISLPAACKSSASERTVASTRSSNAAGARNGGTGGGRFLFQLCVL